jgi:hypothetical protein
MPATVTEKYESRNLKLGASPGLDLVYDVSGVSNEIDAADAVKTTAPEDYGGGTTDIPYMIRSNLKIEPVHIDTDDEPSCRWAATMSYAPPQFAPAETGDSVFQFDTGGGTAHVTQSKITINKYPASPVQPDFQGAIGYSGDAVDGCDIVIPVYNFSVRKYLAAASCTESYRTGVADLTGKTNNAAFRGFAIGEVLFLGASGSQRNEEDWEITYNFSVQRNATGLQVGTITGIAKKGWEYLWVLYKDTEDATAKAKVKIPKAVYVERVYDSGDFSTLLL